MRRELVWLVLFRCVKECTSRQVLHTKFLNDHFLYASLYLADSVEHKVFDFTLLEKIDKTASMFA